MNTNRVMWIVAITLIGWIAGWFAMSLANASSFCVTLSEARERWEGTHLWWYRDDDGRKCWSNRRGGPPLQKRDKPPPEKVAEVKPEPVVEAAPTPVTEPMPMAEDPVRVVSLATPIEASPLAAFRPVLLDLTPVEVDADPEGGVWPPSEPEISLAGYAVMTLGIVMLITSIGLAWRSPSLDPSTWRKK